MSQERKPPTCESCGQAYVVEDVSEIYLDYPVSYGKGLHRFCLACWVGVGPNDQPSLFQDEPGLAGRVGGEIGKKRGKLEGVRGTGVRGERNEKSDLRRPPSQGIYLWLRCEGWMKFGPFEWLRFDEHTSTISESTGKIVAWKEGKRWFVPSGRGAGMAYDESFMITNSPRHPDPDNRSLPAIKQIEK